MKTRFFAIILSVLILISVMFTGCNTDEQNTKSTQSTEESTQGATVDLDGKTLEDYMEMYVQGDNPLYGTWQIEDFEYISFIFRNDGLAEMVTGTEGNFTQLTIDESAQTLTAEFFISISGTYDYKLSEDNNKLTLTNSDGSIVLNRQDNYNMIPDEPKEKVIDEDILGWWKSQEGLIYYFGDNGIMYTNIVSMETCYTYTAVDGEINAVYDMGGESTVTSVYSYSEGELTIDQNSYTPFNPFE